MNRISLFGGPGVGKSTLAAFIFAHLKGRGHNVELVQEFVKQWVYEGRVIKPWHYVYTFGKQFEAEHRLLSGGVERIVTDSPLLLQCAYAHIRGCPVADQLTQIALAFEREYPSTNFLVHRKVPYQEAGRYETAKEAEQVDSAIEAFLQDCDVECHLLDPTDREQLARYLKVLP